MTTKTAKEADREYTENLDKKYGGMARLTGLCVSSADQEQQEYDAEFLEWHGYPEVAGTNGDLAGVLIDAETTMLLDMAQEKIIETEHTGVIAMTYELCRERDAKKLAEIMALYHRLVGEHLKQYYKVAG